MIIGGLNIRAFVVTLQEVPEREHFIRDHFKQVGVEAESFNGLHAVTAGLQTVFPYERDSPGSGWNIGKKPVACWVSFWALWSAMQFMSDTHFLQLEYDSKFPDDWRKRTEQALLDVPNDFDMLYLGSCCTKDMPREHVKGDVHAMQYVQCGHGTVIAKKALPTILKHCRKIYAPLDIHLMLHVLPHLKVYVVLPRIIDQWNTQIPI
jgi:hypothetical protein